MIKSQLLTLFYYVTQACLRRQCGRDLKHESIFGLDKCLSKISNRKHWYSQYELTAHKL